jgi:hypothetical protein
MKPNQFITRILTVLTLGLFVHLTTNDASAHCDTMKGPVVIDAQQALADGDLTPVLKWVTVEDEPEVRRAFDRSLAIRGTSDEVRDVADTFFLETVVRLHRLSEGVGFTGLKDEDVGPAVAAADFALEIGDVTSLASLLTSHMQKALQERFDHAVEARAHMNESVEAGRVYVEAYVLYTHLAEKLAEVIHHAADPHHAH